MTQHQKRKLTIRSVRTRICLLMSAAGSIMLLGAWAATAADVVTVTQSNRKFQPGEIQISRGGAVRFVNDDGNLLHHAFSTSPNFSFDSDEQGPGKTAEARFTAVGTFTVLCGIHPKMRLVVTVR